MDTRLSLAVINWLVLFGLSLFFVFRKKPLSEGWWKAGQGLYFILLASALVAWRWRSICYNGEINVDEGSYIAAVQRFCTDWMPWRSVETGTCGPLSFWLYLWAPALGVKMGYANLRMMGLALNFAILAGIFAMCRQVVGRRFAFALTLLPASVVLFTLNLDFVFFAMELLPSCVLAWMLVLVLREWEADNSSDSTASLQGLRRVFVIGLLGGALPFTKIQASLMGVFLVGALLVLKWLRNRTAWRAWLRTVGAVAAGGVLPAVLILGPVAVAGVWPDFWQFSIKSNIAYKFTSAGGSALFFLQNGCSDYGTFALWTVLASAVAMGWAVFLKRAEIAWDRWLPVAAVVLGLDCVAVYSVLRSGFNFPHYLILLLVPTAWTLAWSLRLFTEHATRTGAQAVAGNALGAVFACVVAVTSAAQGVTLWKECKRAPMFLGDWGREAHPLVDVLSKYAQPGESMAIWGWANKLHVHTGIRPATRMMSVAYVADPNPIYDRHRELFLADLKASKPKIFLDAIDEFRWPTWPAGSLARHYGWPELSSYIRSEYHLVADVQTAPGKLPAMVYVRNK